MENTISENNETLVLIKIPQYHSSDCSPFQNNDYGNVLFSKGDQNGLPQFSFFKKKKNPPLKLSKAAYSQPNTARIIRVASPVTSRVCLVQDNPCLRHAYNYYSYTHGRRNPPSHGQSLGPNRRPCDKSQPQISECRHFVKLRFKYTCVLESRSPCWRTPAIYSVSVASVLFQNTLFLC